MKPRFLSVARLSLPLASAIAALLTAPAAFAGNTWDGTGGTGLWNTNANWNLDTAPSTGVALTFAGNVQNSTTNDLVAVDPSFLGINFTNTGAASNTNAFTLAGSRITLGGNITTTANTAGATITDIINLDMILDGNRTITTNQQSATVQHNLTIGGIISETGGPRNLIKAGGANSLLTLSGANTYTGATTVSNGTLSLNNLNAIQNSTSVSVASGATLRFAIGGTYTTAGTISVVGTGAAQAGGGGALWFGQGGSYASTLNAAISLGGATTFGSYGNVMTQNLTGIISGTGPLTINSQGGGATDSATWTIGSAGNASTYTGNTTINMSGGAKDLTVMLGVANALPTTTSLNLQANQNVAVAGFATLDLNGFNQELAGLTDTGSSGSSGTNTGNKRVINSSGTLATLTLNIASGTSTYGTTGTNVTAGTIGGTTAAGVAANNLAVVKNGAGIMVLGGANTYTGGTTISQGTLRVGNATALGANASAVSVTSGAVLDVNGITMTGTNALSLNGSGIGATGALINTSATGGRYAGAITLNSASTIGNTGSVAINANGLTLSSTVNNNGNLLTFKGTGLIGLATTSGISGGGGITVDGVYLSIGATAASMTYLGTTTIQNGGAIVQSVSNGIPTTGNIILNGGYIDGYNYLGFTRALGTGANEIQITGGVSGFGVYGGGTVNLGGAGAMLTWGTPTFNPTELMLGTPGAATSLAGTTTFANAIDLNGTTRTVMANGGAVNAGLISGVISNGTGTAGLTKTGTGELRLSVANTYNGGTTVSAGTLNASTAAARLGSNVVGNDIGVSPGARLLMTDAANAGANQTITLTSTAGSLSVLGLGYNGVPNATIAQADTNGGVIALNSVVGYNQNLSTLLTGKNLFLGGIGTTTTFTGAVGTVVAGNGSTYRLGGGGGTISFNTANLITGANSVQIGSTATGGTGTVVFGASQDFTLGATVNSGSTLTLGVSQGFSGGIAVNSGGTLTINSTQAFAGGVTLASGGNINVAASLSGAIFGTGDLTINGGTITTPSTGTFTSSNNSIWNASFNLQRGVSGVSTWNHNGTVSLNGNVTVTSNNDGFNLNLPNTISDAGTNRSLSFGGTNLTATLSGNNSYGGGTTLSAGTLIVGHANALGTGSGTIALNGGTIQSSDSTARSFTNAVTIGGNFTVGGTGNMTFSNTGISALGGSRIITVTTGGVNATFAQSFTGSGNSITKAGAGTLTLSGNNAGVTGGTTITGGTLILAGATALPAGTLTFGTTNTTLRFENDSNLAITNTLEFSGRDKTRTIVVDRLTAGAAINLSFSGIPNLDSGTGASTVLNFQKGADITSGTPTITFVNGTTSSDSNNHNVLYPTIINPTDVNVVINGISNGNRIKYYTFQGNSTGNLVSGITTGGAVVTITKSGTGTWKFGANTYNGSTTITAGTLIAANASALGSGAGRNVSVAAGAALNYAAVADANLSITGTLGITGGTNTAIGGSIGSTLTGAQIAVTGIATISDAAHKVNIYGIPGITTGSTGTYTLIAGGAGSSLNPTTAPTLGTVYNNSNFTVGAFTRSATALQVDITSATAITSAHWIGGLSGNTTVWAASNGSSASNWATTSGGAVQALTPGSLADVVISGNESVAPTATVLGASMSIGSLTISDTTNGLGIVNDGNTLTIANAAGITMNASVPASSIAANVALGASQTWTNNSANTLTVSGVVSGAFNLSTAGTGTIILDGLNTYSGTTTIGAGSTLQIGPNGRLTAGTYNQAISIGTGSTFRYSGSNAQTLSGAITGAGGLTKDTNTSDLILSSTSNTYSGTTTISAGRIQVSAATNLSSGATSIVQSGTGQVYISNAVTISNPFNISTTGYLEGGDSQNNVDGAIRLSGSTLSGTITLSGNSRIGTFGTSTNTISGRITGGFGIDFYGFQNTASATEVFVLSNTGNDYTGNTTIYNSNYNTTNLAGVSTTLRLGASNVIPNVASGGNVVFAINGTNDNATVILDLNGFSDTINGLTVNAGTFATRITNSVAGASVLTIGANNTTSSFGGTITNSTGTLAITKTGGGSLTLTGTNNYSGATSITGGTLQLGNNTTTGSLTGTSSITVTGATLSVNRSNAFTQAADLNGKAITGTGGFTQAGSGTTTLSLVNTYTGATNVNAGTLLINGSTSTSSVVTVAAGATLGGSGTIGGNTTISGIHSPGNSPGVQTITGDLTYNNGASVLWELTDNGNANTPIVIYDAIEVDGALTFSGSTTLTLDFTFGASLVDWANAYWDTDHAGTNGWLIYTGSTSITGFSNLSITAADWADEQGDLFSTTGGTFGLYEDTGANGIYLTYVIPEPRAAILGGLGMLMLLRRRRN